MAQPSQVSPHTSAIGSQSSPLPQVGTPAPQELACSSQVLGAGTADAVVAGIFGPCLALSCLAGIAARAEPTVLTARAARTIRPRLVIEVRPAHLAGVLWVLAAFRETAGADLAPLTGPRGAASGRELMICERRLKRFIAGESKGNVSRLAAVSCIRYTYVSDGRRIRSPSVGLGEKRSRPRKCRRRDSAARQPAPPSFAWKWL